MHDSPLSVAGIVHQLLSIAEFNCCPVEHQFFLSVSVFSVSVSVLDTGKVSRSALRAYYGPLQMCPLPITLVHYNMDVCKISNKIHPWIGRECLIAWNQANQMSSILSTEVIPIYFGPANSHTQMLLLGFLYLLLEYRA
ncbi:hypothetical protein CEXT_204741 [Caerostris extrusa]|uniref:Uncharacterized protein n=1 Tax=Caerostris extrusa TaxID=172846 RepID=A0AAV4TRY9_CAEEX|nr:hypothetical protein CEXT_204741 [Caerostris extrusa]